MAGRAYATGLATHARSRIQVRVTASGARLRGQVAVDDTAPGATAIVFKILGTDGAVLFASPPLVNQRPPVAFSVELAGRRDLLLAAETSRRPEDLRNAHADWLDLQVGD